MAKFHTPPYSVLNVVGVQWSDRIAEKLKEYDLLNTNQPMKALLQKICGNKALPLDRREITHASAFKRQPITDGAEFPQPKTSSRNIVSIQSRADSRL